jgi:uncharacterized membrane protein
MAGQSRRASALEAAANVAAGVVIAFVANIVILPALGVPVTFSQAAQVSAAFTVVSLIRSYALRRIFNYIGGRIWRA